MEEIKNKERYEEDTTMLVTRKTLEKIKELAKKDNRTIKGYLEHFFETNQQEKYEQRL